MENCHTLLCAYPKDLDSQWDKVAYSQVGQLSYTFKEVEEKVLQFCDYLKNIASIQPSARIGLWIKRDINSPIIMLSLLRLGYPMVILNPESPKRVMEDKIHRLGIDYIICNQDSIPEIPLGVKNLIHFPTVISSLKVASFQLPPPIEGNEVAVIMFTSGSTGNPKGVFIPHKALSNRFSWMWECYPFAIDEIIAQKTSLNFVDSLWEILGGFLRGVPTFILEDEYLYDTDVALQAFIEKGITRLTMTPTYLTLLLEKEDFNHLKFPSLRFLFSSGEPLHQTIAKKFKTLFPQVKLINLYGSTEVAADVTFHEYDETKDLGPSIPMGTVIPNNRILLLNDFQEDAQNEIGELYIIGDNLALGYDDPLETDKRFTITTEGARLFKTGDLCKIEDGLLYYMGRKDRQVKINGIRIEPAEIENILMEIESVEKVIVVSMCGQSNFSSLVVFIKTSKPHPIMFYQDYLRDRLDPHKMPHQFLILKEFPKTVTGKVDVKMLEKGFIKQNYLETTNSATQSIEEVLLCIWQSILHNNTITIHDNLFEQGTKSLAAMRALSQIRKQLNIKSLNIKDIFNFSSISQLAKRISNDSEYLATCNIDLHK